MAAKKTQSKNTKKSTQKTTRNNTSTAKEQVKKPLLSTARKIGIAMYFTFLGTLALAFGVSIWMADILNPPSSNTPKQTNEYSQSHTFENQIPTDKVAKENIQTQNQNNNPTIDENQNLDTRNYDYEINNSQSLPQENTTTQENINQATEYDIYCPNGNCEPLLKFIINENQSKKFY